MIITTQRLMLEPLGMKYLDSTYKYSSDIENTRYMRFLPDNNIEETIEFLQCVEAEWKKDRPSFYEFAILLDRIHIGAISVYYEEPPMSGNDNNVSIVLPHKEVMSDKKTAGELGWIIDREYQGFGYASEAAKAMLDFAVNKLGINCLFAHCDADNGPSYKLMEKLGMKYAGRTGGRFNKSSKEEREELTYTYKNI